MDFLSWFRSHGGYLHPSAELASSSDGQRFLRVREGCTIAANEKAISCPHSLTLSAVTENESGHLSDSVSLLNTSALPRSVAFRIRLMNEYVLGKSSFWWDYIRSMPQPYQEDCFSTALYFDSDDRLWLEGTNLGNARDTKLDTWREEFEEASKSFESLGEELQKHMTWELYIWAATIITSRCFPAALSSQATLGLPVLVPGLDFLNHSPSAKVTWDWSPIDCAIRTDEALEGGSLIFNNYGPKSNEELLMGYGFCLDPNPADSFNLSYSRALTRHIESVQAQKRSDYTKQASNHLHIDATNLHPPAQEHQLLQDIHRVRLAQKTSEEGDDADTESSPFPHYSFSPGFLSDFSMVLSNERERVLSGSSDELPKEMTSFSSSTLSRNKLHVLSALIMILQDKLRNIRKYDSFLPKEPQNQKQSYAAVYRASQIRILRGVLRALEETLASITSVPRPGKELTENGEFTHLGPLLNRVVHLSDILGVTDYSINTNIVIDNPLPGQLKQPLRAVINAGLGTRDPAKILRRGGEEFAFSMWICGLWLVKESRSASRDDVEGMETSDDKSSTVEENVSLGPELEAWLEKLQTWYTLPLISDGTPPLHVTGSENPGSSDTTTSNQNQPPDSLDTISDLRLTATSYLSAIQAAVTKHPDSLYNHFEIVTIERLMWCLSVVRGEGVRCPNRMMGLEGTGGEEFKERLTGRRERDGDGEGDELVMVMELG